LVEMNKTYCCTETKPYATYNTITFARFSVS